MKIRTPVTVDARFFAVVDADGCGVAECNTLAECDAIANVINAHDVLVAALRLIVAQDTGSVDAPFGLRGTAECPSCEVMHDIAKQALAAVEVT